jgi:adenosylcobinamide-GDP ribazoletransferase
VTAVAREVVLALAAVQYFTRIPVPAFVGHSQEALNAAARYFPLVGLLVGAIASGVLWLAGQVFPIVVAVLLATAVSIWITGAFHEDGLADSVDALGGGFTRERVLEIMRDSRIGTYGALALLLVVAIKVATLSSMTLETAAVLLVVGHTVSRAAAVAIMYTLPYVREDASKAKPLVQSVSPATFAIALAFGAVVLGGLASFDIATALMIAVTVTAVTLYWRGLLKRRLNGYTGDCLGAAQQLTEVATYLTALAVWSI